MPSLTKIQTGFLEPQGAFELTPGTSSSPGLFFTGDTSTGMFSPSSGVLGFSTGSTQQALTILANGNVGIGTDNPSKTLSILSSQSVMLQLESTSSTARIGFKVPNTTNSPTIGVADNEDIQFRSGGNERLRITSAGNVGIGTNNPAYKLHVEGGAYINDGALEISDGASPTLWLDAQDSNWPAIIFKGTPVGGSAGTQMGSVGFGGLTNQELEIWSTGTVALKSTSYSSTDGLFVNNNNVGIGTTNPQNKLHVIGSIEIPDNLVLKLGSYGGSEHTIRYNTPTQPGMMFRTAGTDKMIITSGGSVGIGTVNPTDRLHVIGHTGGSNPPAGQRYNISRFVSSHYVPTNSGGLTIGAYWNNTDVNGRRAFIQSSQGTDSGSTSRDLLLNPDGGNVGIGTTNPKTKIDSRGNILVATNSNGNNILSFGNSDSYGPLSGAPDSSHGSSFIVGNSSTASGAPGYMSFWTTNSGVVGERLRITSSGGITFNGDTAAANALDDYEEGNYRSNSYIRLYDPNDTSSSFPILNTSSWNSQGFYIKIGGHCTVNHRVQSPLNSLISNLSSTTYDNYLIRITLPFVVSNLGRDTTNFARNTSCGTFFIGGQTNPFFMAQQYGENYATVIGLNTWGAMRQLLTSAPNYQWWFNINFSAS